MLTLSQEPRPRGVRKLSDREYYRIRVGKYRILYTINDDDKVVTIYRVDPRKDAYKS
ncbi:MAG: type II toxin-antitoxin system RelE/ParE family toxin [Candidatus Zixiibacteriota bacterium]|nr:MAG: type II toxin-antitoxin system RelE/ParE family toxin [candidate division Zixibacteria bacterium]